jgi:hypothetical protein
MDMQVLVTTENDTVLQRDVQVVNIKCTFTDPHAETIVYDTNFVENLTFMTQTVIASAYDATVMVIESQQQDSSDEQKPSKEVIQERLGKMKRMNTENSCDCLICHDPITTNQFYRSLPICKHKFHKKCIDSWIFQNPTCPTCRNSIFSN